MSATVVDVHGSTAEVRGCRPPSGPAARLRRFVRGRESDPAWARPGLLALLAGTALLYLIGLGASGWANSFYSAAVEAGAHSWKAFFFGSFDSSNFITVDKPPASLWVMDISARIFGVNAWSILVPQALEGVAAVGLLYATVRRRFGAGAGLIAGAVLATTPVAVLMFRFNNPDALLVLLMVAAAYAVTRALESASTRWLVFAGTLIGMGFLTKMLQAFLVVPGFALVYLCFAPTSVRRRVLQLLAAGVAVVVSAGWWIAAVSLTPASARPYIGGSTDNSILQLAFGYNGFGRLTGNETGSVGGSPGGGGGGMWGSTGITRLFGSDMGTQISWLLPAALILGVAALWVLRRVRTDARGRRAQVWLWGSWLVVTGLVFSFSKGIIHPYYTVALAPAIGALVGIGTVALWPRRRSWAGRAALVTTVLVTALWAHHLLARTPSWQPWLRELVLVGGIVAAVVLALPPTVLGRVARYGGRLTAATALVVVLAAPAAYATDTASTPHTGAIPSAGPAGGSGFGPGGGPGRFAGAGAARPGFRGFGGQAPGSTATPPQGASGLGGLPGSGSFPGGSFPGGSLPGGSRPGGSVSGRANGGFGGATPSGGGLLNAGSVSSTLASALKANASSYRWVAATIGAENASGYQLSTDEPVMAIGGFNGTDNAPSLAVFEKYVAEKQIHYFIAGGMSGGLGGGPRGTSGSDDASQITSWVESHFTAKTIGGTTVYDLTSPSSTSAR